MRTDYSQNLRRAAVWSRYWNVTSMRPGADSLGASQEGGTIAHHWRRTFSSARADDVWLDLCSGGGALERLWLCAERPVGAQLHAVDIATQPPVWLRHHEPVQGQPTVKWHAGTRAEDLPFRTASIRAVVSQYGLEYTDLAASLPEVTRVLMPQGRMHLLLHHRESRPCRLAAVELAHLKMLTQPGGLWTTTLALIEPFSRLRSANGVAALQRDADANALRERFNSQQRDLESHKSMECPELTDEAATAVASVLQAASTQGPIAARQKAEAFEARWEDALFRLNELLKYALDNDAMARMADLLATHRLPCEYEPLADGRFLLGWKVTAEFR